MKKLKRLNEDFSDEMLLDIDFSEFDKVVGFQAVKDDDSDTDVNVDSGVKVDFSEIEDDYDSIDDFEEYIRNNIVDDNKYEPVEEKVVDDSVVDDSVVDISEDDLEEGKNYKSLAEVYEMRKNFKTNKLVESILCDSVVDCVYDALVGTLNSHGITKANSIIILGLMLDRMLKADDNEVVKPDFIKDVLGELIDNDKEVIDIVHTAIQNALTCEPTKEPITIDPELVNIQANNDKDNVELITVKEEEE